MPVQDTWLRVALAVLAAWRVTRLLVVEDGPADLLARLRRRFAAIHLGRVVECFYCASVWIALPFAWWAVGGIAERIVAWLAISGGACLLESLSQAPVVIEPLGGNSNGLLRTESKHESQPATVGDLHRA